MTPIPSESDGVSIVIPCRDEEKFIGGCLDSILTWDGCAENIVEVLVVDGMSNDRTREIAGEFVKRDARIRILDNPSKFKPHALNVGIHAAKGKWIMRLDAHSLFPKDYLLSCIETSVRTHAENVGGIAEAVARDSSLQAALIQALTTHKFGVGNSDFRLNPEEGPSDTVPFGFFRREVFDRIGLFDEQLLHTQDQEFNERIRNVGGVVWLNPRIRVQYFNQGRLFPFFKKALLDRGPWNPYRWWLAPYSFRWRHAIPILFVLGLILAAVAVSIDSRAFYVVGAAGGLYALLAIFSAVQQALRYRRISLAFLLPFLFPMYHVSYGAGGLLGFIRLLTRTAPVQQTEK